jgi:hypothetical protein
MKIHPHHSMRLLIAGAALALASGALAQSKSDMKEAGTIASQPARDVGVSKTKIPPILEDAAEAPYSMTGMGSCAAISAEVRRLNGPLGPDFSSANAPKKTSVAKVGGTAVVNSLIPFRGVVREISGAAAADRRLQAATDAGIARRGFLRGVYQTRGCKGRL